MGAVEDAQIAAAAQAVQAAPETVGMARGVVYVLSMVADDLAGVIAELESFEGDTGQAQHALGLVTGALAAVAPMADEGREA